MKTIAACLPVDPLLIAPVPQPCRLAAGCHATHALAADIVFDPVRGQGPKEINVRNRTLSNASGPSWKSRGQLSSPAACSTEFSLHREEAADRNRPAMLPPGGCISRGTTE
jgi:hypothetical protein